MLRRFIGSIVFCAAALTACSRGTSAGRDVAPIGDTAADVRSSIQSARAAGMHPVFASIACETRTDVFSPYAQIVRTDRAAIVRAYSQIFVFPLRRTQVRFDGRPVDAEALPVVQTSASRHAFEPRSGCDPRALDAAAFAGVTDAWNGLRDPWQRSAPLVPWTKGAELDASGNAPRGQRR